MTSKLESWRRAAYNAEECLAGCLASPEIAKHLDQATARTILERLSQARIEMLAASNVAQPAAGEPEQQTAINADDLPTKKYPLGAFDFDSPAAAPVTAGEPETDAKQLAASLKLVRRWECPGQAPEWEFEVPGSYNRHVVASSEQVARAKVAQDVRREAPPAAAHGETVAYRVIGDHGTPLTDWIDGNPGPDPVAMIVGGRYVQRAYAAAHGDELVAVVGTVPDGSGFKSLDFKVELQDLPDGTRLYAQGVGGAST